ncbi:hypothetical protein COOONC_13412 [Cooperia oncophora]
MHRLLHTQISALPWVCAAAILLVKQPTLFCWMTILRRLFSPSIWRLKCHRLCHLPTSNQNRTSC